MNITRFFMWQMLAALSAIVLLVTLDRLIPVRENVIQIHSLGLRYATLEAPESREVFRHFLKEKNLVVFGSSELSEPTPAVVQSFFREQLGRPVLALGAAGAQSLIILTQLLSESQHLQQDNPIVVILSPWWYLTRGTHPGAMHLFVPREMLAEIQFNSSIDPRFKNHLSSYFEKRGSEFGTLSIEQMATRYPALARGPLGPLVQFFTLDLPRWVRSQSRLYSYLHGYQLAINDPGIRPIENFDWPSQLNKARLEQSAKITTNPYGFEDSVWPTYQKTVPREIKSPHENREEFNDLVVLIDFLKSKNIQALFIYQPVNPLAYTHLERFEPLEREIEELVKSSGMSFFRIPKAEYEKEVLKDLAHFSSYGWMKVNHAIDEWLKSRGPK